MWFKASCSIRYVRINEPEDDATRRFLKEMAHYDDIGAGYDTTRRADPYLAGRLIDHLAPLANQRYLDLGCGTGNYAVEVARRDVRVIAVDQSRAMIAAAKRKSAAASTIAWAIADAEFLPLANCCVKGAVCFLAHHHFHDVDQAFPDVFRVLDCGGRFVLFNTTADQLRGFWLGAYFPRMMEQAIELCERLDTRTRLENAGFVISKTEIYDVSSDLKDWFLYCGKHAPARYLDPSVRANISAFASPEQSSEVARGCARLAQDIATGRFKEVAVRYRNDRGDYTFWVALKP
jgi:ubiquinone/menaquinone biosynthesis C-methylase UbiE